jgi:hypothetical protein
MRRVILGLLQLALAPLLLACALERRFGGERIFAAGGELLSLVPGWVGSMVRNAFYRSTLEGCSDRAYIGPASGQTLARLVRLADEGVS